MFVLMFDVFLIDFLVPRACIEVPNNLNCEDLILLFSIVFLVAKTCWWCLCEAFSLSVRAYWSFESPDVEIIFIVRCKKNVFESIWCVAVYLLVYHHYRWRFIDVFQLFVSLCAHALKFRIV